MLRFLSGASAALLLVLAGFFAWKGLAQGEDNPVPPPPPAAGAPGDEIAPPAPPAADARTKEQRRFDRVDRNKDGRITLAEMYEPRRKAFARLDTNGDGRLSFEEWAVRTRDRFQGADGNRDGALDRTEYATTAPRPRPPAKQKGCVC